MAKGVFRRALWLSLLIGAVAGCSVHGRRATTTIASIGQPAPTFDETTAAGGKLSLRSLRGKAVYLNFFATWCPPCNAEAPELERVQREFASRGVQIVGVDVLENASLARAFVHKYGLTYPVLVDEGNLTHAYEINGLPVHAFIDRNGILRKVVIGELSQKQMIANIRALLAESASQ